MVEIDLKIPQFVYFPKTQNTTGIYTLHLHSELSQKDWTFDVTDQANLKDYYKFYVDFSTVDDGEFNYHICAKDSSTELDTGLIRIGVVKDFGNKSYDDDVQIIQYDMYATPVSVTGITVDNLSWGASNIPATGGTADASDCTFTVTAHNSDNTTTDITSAATVTGSLVVPATTATTVQPVGTLTLTFAYDGYTATASTTVYQDAANVPYTNQYLTFDIISGGTIKWTGGLTEALPVKTIEYSKNNGEWTSITASTGGTIINVNAGDKVRLRGNNPKYLGNRFSYSSCVFNLYGNIMSLIYGDNFADKTSFPSGSNFNFKGLFNDTNVVDASTLVLPATTLAENCYYYMFSNCTSLTTAPALPATTLEGNCYSSMFQGCTSLTTAPELPATNLSGASYCYQSMFALCTSLTTAPALPATTLARNCYQNMFYNCTSLATAPTLPATTLTNYCYNSMFYGCTNLNYIKCLATDISANSCTNNWVSGVNSTGTFVKDPSMTGWTTGNSGIPANWDVVNN